MSSSFLSPVVQNPLKFLCLYLLFCDVCSTAFFGVTWPAIFISSHASSSSSPASYPSGCLWSREVFCPLAKITHLQKDQKLFLLLTCQFLSPKWKKSALNFFSQFLLTHTVSVTRSPYTAVPPRADWSAGGVRSWVDQGFKPWVQALCSLDEAT